MNARPNLIGAVRRPWRLLCLPWLAMVLLAGAGCGRSGADSAFDSDANGYLCPGCHAKFYTERSVFPTQCPQCRRPKPELALGFVCAVDQHVSVAARSRGTVACEQCGQPVSAVKVLRETDFKTWGAVKKSRAEVGG